MNYDDRKSQFTASPKRPRKQVDSTSEMHQPFKSMAKAKVKLKKVEKKAATKASKPSKPIEKAKLADASKAKSNAKAPAAKTPPKIQPTAAKAKVSPAPDTKKESKKAKASKKEPKAKKEELDLFDDGDVPESEELLEYQEELDVADEIEEPADSDDSLLESAAVQSGAESEEDIILTDAEGNRYCRAKDCDQISIVEGYCRFHYLLFWKKIQVRKEILQDGKLEKYVDDLTSRYPDKFLEMLRKDLRTTKDFLAAIAELEIDESAGENEFEEDAQTFIDEVRGISDTGASMEDDEF